MVELAAEVVQVIAASAQNPESVPEPDQLRHQPKQHFAKAVHAVPQSPSQSNRAPVQLSAELSTDPSQERCAVSDVERKAGQPAAVHLDITEAQAALQSCAPQHGQCQEMAAPPAEQNRSPASSLQPKAIPSLSIGSQRSSSLFRQPPRSMATPSITPVPSKTPVNPSQQGAATCTATAVPASSASAGSLTQTQVPIPAASAAAAAGAAAEQADVLASEPAENIDTDMPGATAAKLPSHGVLAGPGTQSLPTQRQPTRLGSMLGASGHARRGPGTAMLSALSQEQKSAARTLDQVGFCLCVPKLLAAWTAGPFPGRACLTDVGLPESSLMNMSGRLHVNRGLQVSVPQKNVQDGASTYQSS